MASKKPDPMFGRKERISQTDIIQVAHRDHDLVGMRAKDAPGDALEGSQSSGMEFAPKLGDVLGKFIAKL